MSTSSDFTFNCSESVDFPYVADDGVRSGDSEDDEKSLNTVDSNSCVLGELWENKFAQVPELTPGTIRQPTVTAAASTNSVTDVSTKPIWFSSYKGVSSDNLLANNDEGVLYVPPNFPISNPQRPHIAWYFAFDVSGSMVQELPIDCKLPLVRYPLPCTSVLDSVRPNGVNAGDTRYSFALKLFRRVLTDLQAANRDHDTVSIVTISSEAKVLCQDVSVEEALNSLLHMPIPKGNTNLSEANTVLHSLMSQNQTLTTTKTHRAVEIYFTDGEPTVGLLFSSDLKQQKQEYYSSLRQTTGEYPFVWMGAISLSADWRLVRNMSLASPNSLWSHVTETEMNTFSAEVGLVLSAALNMKTANLMSLNPVTNTCELDQMMVLPDTCNLCYFERPNVLEETAVEVRVSPTLVKLLAIENDVENHRDRLTMLDVCKLKDCVEKLRGDLDPEICGSVALAKEFTRKRIGLLSVLSEMETSGKTQLTRQLSSFRDHLQKCDLVRATSESYRNV